MTTALAPAGAADLDERLKALAEAARLASGRLEPELVVAAEGVVNRADARLRVGTEHTVVALAGATGSGKSSLFNALSGGAVSAVGVRRPTTGATTAATWGEADVGGLLDWLGVAPERRHVGTGAAPDGLVLLDLPDHDSVRRAHREEVDRLVARADVLVWVVDPQKYADAALHDDYLRPLASHRAITVVVLNQADRLAPREVEACLSDLAGLLAADGLAGVPLLAVSAATGGGLERFQSLIADRVAARRAAVERLMADIASVADDLGRSCHGMSRADGRLDKADRAALTAALAAAAGADVVVDAVGRSHRRDGRAVTGWPLVRWAGRVRRDPLALVRSDRLARLRRSDAGTGTGIGGGGVHGERAASVGPSALGEVGEARVALALSDVARATGQDLPEPWPGLVRRAVPSPRELAPPLVHAVASPDVPLPPPPRWWRPVNVVQLTLVVIALAGLLWLTALGVVAWLRIPEPPTPDVGAFPVPTLALLGGVAAGLLVALVCRPLVVAGARRRQAAARRVLHASVAQVAEQAVFSPVAAELTARTDLCSAAQRARGGRTSR